MSDALWQSLAPELRAKILLMDADGICATNSAMRNICEQFWFEAVATEKLYWEERYTVDGVVEGVPEDNVRQDMDETDERRRGFARILDLIHRRDGVKLEVNKLPKNITMKKAYTSLVGARNWAPHHWRPNRQAFSSIEELRQAIADFMKNKNGSREAVINTYGEPEAWIVTQLDILSELTQSERRNHINDNNLDSDDDDFVSKFNEPIGAWDTSRVTDMDGTFCNCEIFDQYIGAWHTSKVTTMRGMFMYASSFDQPIGDWNTSRVLAMNKMFQCAANFNQPIAKWDTSKVRNMAYMFSETDEFNQPIGNWDTGNVTTLEEMFSWAKVFNQPINDWNTSNVEIMNGMFQHARVFNQHLCGWDTRKVKNMSYMFTSARVFNQHLGNWKTSKVEHMKSMFERAFSFNKPINLWDTSNVKNMADMFYQAKSFNQSIDEWDTSKVEFIDDIFVGSQIDRRVFDKWNLQSLNERSRRYVELVRRRLWQSSAASTSVVSAVFASHGLQF